MNTSSTDRAAMSAQERCAQVRASQDPQQVLRAAGDRAIMVRAAAVANPCASGQMREQALVDAPAVRAAAIAAMPAHQLVMVLERIGDGGLVEVDEAAVAQLVAAGLGQDLVQVQQLAALADPRVRAAVTAWIMHWS